jgi:hypothetical protein
VEAAAASGAVVSTRSRCVARTEADVRVVKRKAARRADWLVKCMVVAVE